MRSGVCLVLVLAAAIGAASARAGGTTTATTATTSTTTTTTTSTTTGTTTAATTPSSEPLAATPLPSRCVGAGGILITEPNGAPVALDTPATDLGAAAYPEDGSVVAFSAASGGEPGCRPGHLSLSSVSLFAGAVTIGSVSGRGGRAQPNGLEVDGAPVSLAAGESVAVGNWGRLSLGGTVGQRLSAGLVLRLLRAHGPLPAGTSILIGFAEAPLPAARLATPAKTAKHAARSSAKARSGAKRKARHRRKHKHGVPQPLKVTPPLKQGHYVFPVDGGASYGDTYGAGRSDIYDGWHHGDDLFAPLGTPVVAVANGELTLVGWNALGGWRLWLTDAHGNSFYYAHLAGYSPRILHHRHVRAGQVIGFVGHTGDAFPTPPHLHFEVHPHQLLRLGYDGAVDPTSYLHRWRVVHVPAREIPRPARLVAPKGTPRQESNVVWHQLLVARHLLPHGGVRRPEAVRRAFPDVAVAAGRVPRIVLPIAAVRVAERVAPPEEASPWPTAVGAGILPALFLALFVLRWRRRRPRVG